MPTDNLFQLGKLTLASGKASEYKIECDALTDTDWECLAYLASKRVPKFSHVFGVPTGGLRFARALEKYITLDAEERIFLIADDVFTTGRSMRTEANNYTDCTVFGVCAFARVAVPHWVTAVFVLTEERAHAD